LPCENLTPVDDENALINKVLHAHKHWKIEKDKEFLDSRFDWDFIGRETIRLFDNVLSGYK
jgi:hypothetical protein